MERITEYTRNSVKHIRIWDDEQPVSRKLRLSLCGDDEKTETK